MEFNLKIYKGWDSYIDVTQSFVPGIIKTLIDGIAFISNMENVLMGEILQVAGLDIKAIVINIEEEGIKAAEICTLNCLSVIKGVIGSLDKIEQVVKLTAFVNCADYFTSQPKIANGASELLVKIFGDKGKHARSAIGVSELPLDAPVEIEMLVKVKN